MILVQQAIAEAKNLIAILEIEKIRGDEVEAKAWIKIAANTLAHIAEEMRKVEE